MKISKRDVKVFLLGVLTMFLLELALSWSDFVKGFKDGYNSARTE